MNSLVISENDEIIYNGVKIDNSEVNHDFIKKVFNQLVKKDIAFNISDKSSYGLLFLELKNTVESVDFQGNFNDIKNKVVDYQSDLKILEEEIKKI